MKILVSQLTGIKKYSKARRRIAPILESLQKKFEPIPADPSFPKGIVIFVVTEEKGFLEIGKNIDGFFEANVGFDWSLSMLPQDDKVFAATLFQGIAQALNAYPGPEKERLLEITSEVARTI